jgi:predicted nucleotidyltransferase
MASSTLQPPELAPQVSRVLDDFLKAAQSTFKTHLLSVVMYGSAAEGRLRPTSDLNLIVVLSAFDQQDAEQLRQPFRAAQSAIQLRVLFLLREEIPAATRFFAPKFADILRRRVILFGADPFAGTTLSRDAEIRQLKQQLLNLKLRMRSAYVSRGLREEQLASAIVNYIGPLRSYAATLLELESHPGASQEEAFARLGAELLIPDWENALSAIAAMQEARLPPPGAAARVFFQLLEFAAGLYTRVEGLPAEVRS